MSDDTKDFWLTMLLCGCFSFMASGITHSVTDWSWRRQIAGHHAAEFYVDGHNYRQWRWIDCNPK